MEPEKLFVKRFSELINNGNYTLEEIGNAIGIKSKSTISKYLSGNIQNIKRSQILKLANLFNVSPAWLAGFTDQKYDNTNSKQVFPLLGTVKAGYNYLAHENIIGYVYIDGTIPNPEEYFALKVTGDSMQPVLYDGDIVIVHSQNDIESGQIGIVLLNNDEATIKKVVKYDDHLELIAFNSYYPIKKLTNKDSFKIIGKVVEARIKKIFE